MDRARGGRIVYAKDLEVGGREANRDKSKHLVDSVVEAYVPSGVLISSNFALIHVFGKGGEWLRLSQGRASYDVLRMLEKPLSEAVASASTQALRAGKEVVVRGVKSSEQECDVIAKPVGPLERGTFGALMVSFQNRTNRTNQPEEVSSSDRESDLEVQLQSTREALQTAVEELETTNEELQATNEELMSSNEELQSANEELHSVNEELFTVNSEHQIKIQELVSANTDIEHLFRIVDVGFLFLDGELKIRRFNQWMRKYINVYDHDIGRPLTDLTFTLPRDPFLEGIEKIRGTKGSQKLTLQSGEKTFEVFLSAYNASTKTPKPLGVVVAIHEESVHAALRHVFENTSHFRPPEDSRAPSPDRV